MTSASLSLKCMLATFDVMLGPLLHFLNVVAGIAHVLLAECANHELGLLFCVCL